MILAQFGVDPKVMCGDSNSIGDIGRAESYPNLFGSDSSLNFLLCQFAYLACLI